MIGSISNSPQEDRGQEDSLWDDDAQRPQEQFCGWILSGQSPSPCHPSVNLLSGSLEKKFADPGPIISEAASRLSLEGSFLYAGGIGN